MGKLRCKCGDIISDNTIDSCLMAVNETDAVNGDDDLFDVLCEGYQVWECGNCRRIALFRPSVNIPLWFSPEGDYGKLISKSNKA